MDVPSQKKMVPSGKHTKKLWKDPPFFMGKSTISMAMFNNYVSLPEGNVIDIINDISAYCRCYYL